MTIAEEMAIDLAEMEADTGSPTFTGPDGKSRACAATNLRTGAQLEVGGQSVDVDLILTVRVSVFGADVLPKKKQKIVFSGATYRIDHVIADSTRTYIDLGCVSPTKGI